MSSLFGGVIALCASKILFTTMNQHMSFQIAGPMTCVVALVAIVGLLYTIQRILGMNDNIVCLNFHVLFFSKEYCMLSFLRLKDN